ncbi:hypothetical protein IKP85_06615 [bacterium]|nr:hypothetical protein [bacterium]
MENFEYRFNFKNLHIATELNKDTYTQKEVKRLLRAICTAINYKLINEEIAENEKILMDEMRKKGELVKINTEDIKND